MQPERFDQLTRALGSAVSRRQALKLLFGSAISALAALVSAKSRRQITSAQGTGTDPAVYLPLVRNDCVYEPGPTTFQKATGADVETILQEAEAYEDYGDLRWLLESSDRVPAEQEGATIWRDGREVAHVAVVHYVRPDSTEPAYLVYAFNECDEHVTFALKLELENDLALGFYRNAHGTIQVEVVDLVLQPKLGENQPAWSLRGNEARAITETCQFCLDSCSASQQTRDMTCVVTSAVAAADMAMTGRALYRRAIGGVTHIVLDLVQDAVDVNAIRSSASGIRDCVEQDQLTCAEDGGMCREICAGCDAPDGISCQGNRVCSGGECRTPCGETLCRASEVCVDGRCVPLEHNCGEYAPMGWYNLGYTWGPACCALGPAIDCGAIDDLGRWSGCCPPGTLCGRFDGGATGCCFPGINC